MHNSRLIVANSCERKNEQSFKLSYYKEMVGEDTNHGRSI